MTCSERIPAPSVLLCFRLTISGKGTAMAAERRGPTEVAPLRIGALEIRALHWGRRQGLPQNGGYIEAWRASADPPEWRLRAYQISYEENMQEDVQDVFIENMALTLNGLLQISDEDGHEYLVGLETRDVEASASFRVRSAESAPISQ